MDIWVALAYLLFTISVLIGLALCWKCNLPVSQKIVWSGIIIGFPIAGTVIFLIASEDAKRLFT